MGDEVTANGSQHAEAGGKVGGYPGGSTQALPQGNWVSNSESTPGQNYFRL